MEPRIGIKIEGPKEEKISPAFMVLLIVAMVFVLLTIGVLLAEMMNIPLPRLF